MGTGKWRGKKQNCRNRGGQRRMLCFRNVPHTMEALKIWKDPIQRIHRNLNQISTAVRNGRHICHWFIQSKINLKYFQLITLFQCKVFISFNSLLLLKNTNQNNFSGITYPHIGIFQELHNAHSHWPHFSKGCSRLHLQRKRGKWTL